MNLRVLWCVFLLLQAAPLLAAGEEAARAGDTADARATQPEATQQEATPAAESAAESAVGTPDAETVAAATDGEATTTRPEADPPIAKAPDSPADADDNADPPAAAVQAEAEKPLVEGIPKLEVGPSSGSSIQPLAFLDSIVDPGTAAHLSWTPRDSFAGIAAPTPVLVVHGTRPGPVLCLTAAVHGDELNGIEVVRRVIYDLEPKNLAGTVIGVPIVNLQGFRRASRYLPDRRDLNRYFPGSAHGSSAARIAHSFFTDVVRKCEFLVDLHTGSFHRTNLPQLRADLHRDDVRELAQNMGAIVVLHSKGASGSLRRAAVDNGIPAVTMEAGEPHKIDLDAVDHGVKSIEALLHKSGMYERKSMWARQIEPMYYKSRWVRTPNGGILTSRIKLGERVKRGDVLGTVTDPITNYTVEIDTPIDGRVIGMALNQVMHPGFAAYHIGYQSSAEDAASHDAGPDDGSGDELEMNQPLGKNKVSPDEQSSEDAE